MSSVCTLCHFTSAPLYSAFLAGKRSISPTNFDFICFSDYPRAPAPLCDHGL